MKKRDDIRYWLELEGIDARSANKIANLSREESPVARFPYLKEQIVRAYDEFYCWWNDC